MRCPSQSILPQITHSGVRAFPRHEQNKHETHSHSKLLLVRTAATVGGKSRRMDKEAGL